MRKALLTVGIGSMLGIAGLAAPAHGALTADYRFEGKLKSSVNGVPKLVKDGTGLTGFSEQQVKGSKDGVWIWPADTGLRLNGASEALGNRNDYTMVMLVRLDEISDYDKLIHFRGATEDYGFYAYYGGLYPYGPDADRYTEEVFEAGKWVQITLARSKEGKIKCFVGKKLQVREPDPAKTQVIDAGNSLLFLRDDESTLTEETGGRIARLRIWDNALSDKKIKNLGA